MKDPGERETAAQSQRQKRRSRRHRRHGRHRRHRRQAYSLPTLHLFGISRLHMASMVIL